jgi:release factor glutamine methyltransferase
MDASGWLAKSEAFLASRGVAETAANAEFLLAAVLKMNRGALKLQGLRALTEKQGLHFWDLVKKRGRRLPLAYVLGNQPFMGLDIEVTADALVPRPETEELVEEAARLLHSAGRKAPHILEVGTGTGCVSVALAKRFPEALVIATDISAAVLRLALRNAEKHGCAQRIRFMQEDLHRHEAGRGVWADLVISNPPYIPSGVVPTLEPEVLKEPRLALDGGLDGLDALRAIIADAPRHLKPGAFLVLEIGFDQGSLVAALLKTRGFKEISVRPDAQGHERIAVGRR